jgi:hypothetical protein
MISIVQYISEGFLGNFDQKFQKTALAKTVDKTNVIFSVNLLLVVDI